MQVTQIQYDAAGYISVRPPTIRRPMWPLPKEYRRGERKVESVDANKGNLIDIRA